jgi:opacity protein-like surface antigen
LFRGFYDFRFQNLSNSRIAVNRRFTYLFNDFDPTRSDSEALPAGTAYEYTNFFARYSSDPRKLFSYNVSTSLGGYFNGNRYQFNSELTYRFQPYGNVSLTFNYNRVELPQPYATSNIFLIGPRLDLTLTRSLFITNFVQFNSQNDNININARLQWRFKPVSDFFIVYTDNYFYSFDG